MKFRSVFPQGYSSQTPFQTRTSMLFFRRQTGQFIRINRAVPGAMSIGKAILPHLVLPPAKLGRDPVAIKPNLNTRHMILDRCDRDVQPSSDLFLVPSGEDETDDLLLAIGHAELHFHWIDGLDPFNHSSTHFTIPFFASR